MFSSLVVIVLDASPPEVNKPALLLTSSELSKLTLDNKSFLYDLPLSFSDADNGLKISLKGLSANNF